MSQTADGAPERTATSGTVDDERGRDRIGPMAVRARHEKADARMQAADCVHSDDEDARIRRSALRRCRRQSLNDQVLGNPDLRDRILDHVVQSALHIGQPPTASRSCSGVANALVTCRSWHNRILSILQSHLSKADKEFIYEELGAEPIKVSRIKAWPQLTWYGVNSNANTVDEVTGLEACFDHWRLGRRNETTATDEVEREERSTVQMLARVRLLLKQLPYVKHLALSKPLCRLRGSHLLLTSTLRQLTQLVSLTYSGHHSDTDASLGALIRALPCLQQLMMLSIDGVEWDEYTLTALEVATQVLAPNLKVLHLNESYLLGYEGAVLLARALRHPHALEELNLRWNNLEGPEATIVLAALRNTKRLSSLALDWNYMVVSRDVEVGESEASGLWCRELGKLSSLTELHLSGVGLGPDTVEFLGPSLYALKRLKHVELDCNFFGDEGVRLLMQDWRDPGDVRYLGIVDDSVTEVGKAAVPNTWTHVHIAWNEREARW